MMAPFLTAALRYDSTFFEKLLGSTRLVTFLSFRRNEENFPLITFFPNDEETHRFLTTSGLE